MMSISDEQMNKIDEIIAFGLTPKETMKGWVSDALQGLDVANIPFYRLSKNIELNLDDSNKPTDWTIGGIVSCELVETISKNPSDRSDQGTEVIAAITGDGGTYVSYTLNIVRLSWSGYTEGTDSPYLFGTNVAINTATTSTAFCVAKLESGSVMDRDDMLKDIGIDWGVCGCNFDKRASSYINFMSRLGSESGSLLLAAPQVVAGTLPVSLATNFGLHSNPGEQ